MGANRIYNTIAIILIFMGVLLAVYPVVGYYSLIHIKSPHIVLKPGNRFAYAGYYPFFNLVMIYNMTYMGNGKFEVNFTLYDQSGNESVIYPLYSTHRSGQIIGNLSPIFRKTLILPTNDSLIRTLFPQGQVTVHALNYSKTVKLTERKYPFSFDFSPNSVGFPVIYVPDLQGNLSKKVDLIAYYRSDDRYFARTLVVIGRNAHLRYPSMISGLPTHVPIGVTPEQLDMPKFIPAELVPNESWSYVERFPTITVLSLLKTNVRPSSQNWLGAFEASFTQFSAPLDYVFILAGIFLLILAGRSGR
ncbi:hypothetical protein [Thermococcus sp.]|uniref:hypothetical protein n=1 Tax=Thermococcus sp. TaxID=35749 RepID=UPI002628D3D3|nr:hypothetical protein [Thermococcus sp.]